MRTVPLGSQGLVVSSQGLGCMGMSQSYGEPDDPTSYATLDRALELGVTFLDTANVYGAIGESGFGGNEVLLSSWLATHRDEVQLATKVGIAGIDVGQASGSGARFELDGSPAAVAAGIDASLQRLGTDHVDLYYLHRVDPATPLEDTIGAMAELVTAGKVRYLGVSEVTADQLQRAHAVHPITAVQSEWSLWTRGLEDEVVPTARRLGVGLVPFSPLGRGYLTGTVTSSADFGTRDSRRTNPRFTDDNLDANQAIVAEVRSVADARGVLPGQVALAWVHAQGDDVVPIPGTKRPTYLEQNVAASDLTLTSDELERLGALADRVTGSRY
ncbi:aldo/keto reductase [Nocardioides sp.]|uniref:aldo/keto reductase n=1 Tax=Nocardioides sp. TaxID=35761 RepID=UPI00272478C0|nr:aldo/keto reductase [Nocardioides sp.]MDO9458431.1 aldo/keto reductase [Nocardioides sp.]